MNIQKGHPLAKPVNLNYIIEDYLLAALSVFLCISGLAGGWSSECT